jgi:hypothetical protein
MKFGPTFFKKDVLNVTSNTLRLSIGQFKPRIGKESYKNLTH